MEDVSDNSRELDDDFIVEGEGQDVGEDAGEEEGGVAEVD